MTASVIQLLNVRGFAPEEDVRALAEEKLASSGLTMEDAAELRLTWHSAVETRALDPTFWGLPSLRIPYLAPDGVTPLRSGPGWPEFYRVRALRLPANENPKHFPKYLQPPNSGVCAYFSPTIDWPATLAEPEMRIIITEGELKAAKACREGFPAIGLGGVYNYRSASQGIELLPELEAINWVRREVVICYDSDVTANPMVCAAVMDLAETLVQRGAVPLFVCLPSDDGVKVGLDDFLIANPPAALDHLIDDTGQFITTARRLWGINETHLFVNGGLVLERATGRTMIPETFRLEACGTVPERVLKRGGQVSMKNVARGAAWLEWPLRASVTRLTYRPGAAPLAVIDGEHGPEFNLWSGWGVERQPGDVAPFIALVNHLFTDAMDACEWFLRWCAYPLQHPGTKLFTTAVIHGVEQGTGKSALGITLGRLYGRNFTEIRQADLTANFNDWAVGRQFILGDDVTGSDKRETLDLLKKLITQQEVRINIKHQPSYTIPDVINYMWTSNRAAAFLLDEQDRRFFIHRVDVKPLPIEFYVDYHKWLDGGGAAHVLDYLLNLDLADFNPHAPAMHTAAKIEMTNAARSDLSIWVHDLRIYADDLLVLGSESIVGDLFTNRELRAIWAMREGVDIDSVKTYAMTTALAEAGFRKVHGGNVIRALNRESNRYYAIRNVERWLNASLPEVQSHLSDMLNGKSRSRF